jgi:hypothetical protein
MYKVNIMDYNNDNSIECFFKSKEDMFSSLSIFFTACGFGYKMKEIIKDINSENELNVLYGKERIDLVIVPFERIAISNMVKNFWYERSSYPLSLAFPKEAKIIEKEFAELVESLDCVDSFRVVDPSDNAALLEYKKFVDTCCCGSVEKTIVVNKREILIGVNYGH